MDTSHILLGGTLQWTSIPSRGGGGGGGGGGVAILLVTACYKSQVKLLLCGLPVAHSTICYASINVKPEGRGDPGHMWGI